MPQIGPLEILVVGVLALLVFGPEKLPEMARSLGKGLTQLKRMASDAKSEFDVGLDATDAPPTRTTPTEIPTRPTTSEAVQASLDHVPDVADVDSAASR